MNSERSFPFQVIVDEMTVGDTLNARALFERIEPFVRSGVVAGVGIMPRRFNDALTYINLALDYHVPIKFVWGTLSGDTRDLLSQIRHSKRLKDMVGVGMIAVGSGLQSEPNILKRYGNTLQLVKDLKTFGGFLDEMYAPLGYEGNHQQIQWIIAHQSMISQLEKTGKLDDWIGKLQQVNVRLLRTNGWSPSLGRDNPLSYNLPLIRKHADKHNYDTAFVTDVFMRTFPDLHDEGLETDPVKAMEQFNPRVLYLADADNEREKIVPGKGIHTAQLEDVVQAYEDMGGNVIALKLSQDPLNPTANLEEALDFLHRVA